MNTKEKIINAAIDLFSAKGFYETSVREIAKASGLKTSSLYSHFAGKESILETILEYYKSELNKIKIPDDMIDTITNKMPPEEILVKGFKLIIDTVIKDKMEKIIKILILEVYRNPKVREFYLEWYFNENRNAIKKLFEKMINKKIIKDFDPEILSDLYNALMNFYYHELYLYKADKKDVKGLENKISKQINLFIELIKNKGAKNAE